MSKIPDPAAPPSWARTAANWSSVGMSEPSCAIKTPTEINMMARVIKIPRMIASYERSSVILVAHVRATIPWRKFLAFEEQLALRLKGNDLTSPNLSRRTRSTGCSLSGLGVPTTGLSSTVGGQSLLRQTPRPQR